MNKIEIGGFTRISKKQAQKLFDAGQEIYLCPVKMNPANPYWSMAMPCQKDENWDDFEKLISNFVYYNCNHETGYYPAFYIKDEGGSL